MNESIIKAFESQIEKLENTPSDNDKKWNNSLNRFCVGRVEKLRLAISHVASKSYDFLSIEEAWSCSMGAYMRVK